MSHYFKTRAGGFESGISVWRLLFCSWIVATASATEYHIAPGTRRDGDGSPDKPWSLTSALQHQKVRPGDTLWLAGGVYQGNFVSDLEGTEKAPITVRAMPGQRVTLDANGLSSPLKIRGKWTTWWGLELMNSHPKRKTDESGSFPTDVASGSAVDIVAPNTKLINLIIHDHGSGVCAMSGAANCEVYGCIIYNNGWQGAERGHGDGIVSQNREGAMKFQDNIVFNQFGLGIQIYGTKESSLNNYDVSGNVVFNNGAVSRDGVTTNIWIGGGATAENITVTNNYTYNSVPWGVHLHAGSGANNKGLKVTGNYFAGHVRIQNWHGLAFTDNLLSAPANILEWIQVNRGDEVEWDRNKYFSLEDKYLPFGITPDGGLVNFEDWKKETGFDRQSQYTKGKPSGTQVVLRPNQYEPDRAHAIVYNWEGSEAATLDCGQFLSMGEEYVVRNVQDYFAAPILTGTFDGKLLELPMNGLTMAAPNGLDVEVAKTGPEFNVFVLERASKRPLADSDAGKQ